MKDLHSSHPLPHFKGGTDDYQIPGGGLENKNNKRGTFLRREGTERYRVRDLTNSSSMGES